MTSLAAIALFATLQVRMDVAPLFKLPDVAVLDRKLRESAIAQRNNYTNFPMRLDTHIATAMYATTEALFERRLFPAMFNYGPARTATVDSLLAADFSGKATNLLSSSWFTFDAVPTDYATGEKRDLSNRGRRIAWPYDWMNGVFYGDIGPAVCDIMPISNSLDEVDPARGERYWLVPDTLAGNGEGPTGEWCTNSPLSTAGWEAGHLLCLGEADVTDLFENHSPWSLSCFNVITNLLPPWASVVVGAAQEAQPLANVSFSRLFRNSSTPKDAKYSARAKALGVGGPTLFWQYNEYSKPHVSPSQVTPRLWWERFAFANVLSSLCSRTVEGGSVAEWRGLDDPPPAAQAPRFRFRRRAFSGFHSATFSASTDTGFSIVPVDGGHIGVVCDFSKFEDNGDFAASNTLYSATTSCVEFVAAGWHETAPSASAVSSALSASCAFSPYLYSVKANADVDFEDYEWTAMLQLDGLYGDSIYYSIFVHGVSDSSDVSPFEGGQFSAYAGSLVVSGAEQLPGSIHFLVRSPYNGVEPTGEVMELRGPTPLESPSVTNEAEWSIAPAPRAKFLWNAGVVSAVDLSKFVSVLVSTNENIMADVLAGKMPAVNSRENLLADTSLFNRYTSPSATDSHSQLVQAFQTFHEIRDDIEAVAEMNGLNTLLPTSEGAAEIPETFAKERAKDIFGGETVITNLVPLSASFTLTGVVAAKQDQWDRSAWHLEMPDPTSLFPALSFDRDAGGGGSPRRSAAYLYEARPVIVTKWNFPLMQDK